MKKTSTRLVAVSLSMVFWGMGASAWAQSPGITEAGMVVNGISRNGQRMTLQFDREVVEKSWKAYLKNQSGSPIKGESFWPFAKAKPTKGIYIIEEGEIDAISSSPLNIVSKVEGGPGSTTLWWALEMGGKKLSQEGTPQEWSRSADLLQQFARNLYQEEIQSELDFAEDVVMYSKEEAKRMELSAGKIQAKISKAQEEKAKMEAALAATTTEVENVDQKNPSRQEMALTAKTRELDNLNKRLERAQIRQEVARQEMEIMSQTMEAVKAKINTMN